MHRTTLNADIYGTDACLLLADLLMMIFVAQQTYGFISSVVS